MNLRELSPRQFVNVVYVWLAQRVEDIDRFESDLAEPLPGMRSDRVDQQTIEAENAALMRFASEAKGL